MTSYPLFFFSSPNHFSSHPLPQLAETKPPQPMDAVMESLLYD